MDISLFREISTALLVKTMVTKENLLGMLKDSLVNEDDFILKYGEDFLKDLMQASDLSDDQKQEIEGILSAILTDTKRHQETITKLMDDVKRSDKNEF